MSADPVLNAQRAHQHRTLWYTGDGARTLFPLDHAPMLVGGELVFVAGALKQPDEPGTAHDYKVTAQGVLFAAAPGAGVKVAIHTGGK